MVLFTCRCFAVVADEKPALLRLSAMRGSESLSLWHEKGKPLTVIEAFIITNNGCEFESLQHGKVDGIAG
jgi:hypothetical protein